MSKPVPYPITDKERETLASNLKYLREAYRLSQQGMVEALEFSFQQTYLSSLETNKKPASEKAVNQIMKTFNLTEDELLRTDLSKILLD